MKKIILGLILALGAYFTFVPAPKGQLQVIPGGGGGGAITGSYVFSTPQFSVANVTNVVIKDAPRITNLVGVTGINLEFATAGKPLVTDGSKNLTTDTLSLNNTNQLIFTNTWFVNTVQQFTNTVYQLNALSTDGARRKIQMAAGTYPLGQGVFRLHVSNNITIQGAGMFQTTITGSGSLAGATNRPMINLVSGCEISDLTLQATNTGANPQLGVSTTLPDSVGPTTSTNVVVNRVRFIGDDDNISLISAGYYDPANLLSQPVATDNSISWTVNDSIFINRFDAVYIDFSGPGNIDATGLNENAPTVVRIYSSKFSSYGPSIGTPTRGDVTSIRLVGQCARAELYGCHLESGGGTNTTSIGWLSNATDIDANDILGGGLFLNNCAVKITGTNLSSGGTGAALAINTNGWIVLNGVNANSNNITGTGTNRINHPYEAGSNITLTTNSSGKISIASTASGTGNVIGPPTSVVRTLAAYNNTTGTLLTNSTIEVNAARDSLIVPGSVQVTNAITNYGPFVGVGTNNGSLRLSGTNTGWLDIQPPTTGQSNMFVYHIINPAADQFFKIHSVVAQAGTNFITLTNDTAASGTVSDVAFASSWNGVTGTAPSKNVVYDWGHIMDTDDDGKVNVLDAADGIIYVDSGGVLRVAVVGTEYLDSTFISDTAFAGSWNGVTTIAPSKNAVYDQLVLAQTGNNVLSNLVGTVANNVTNVSSGWAVHLTTTTGTLTAHATNALTLMATNAVTFQADFTGGTPLIQTADFMRTNVNVFLTNPIVGRVMTFHFRGDGNAVDRTVTVSTNGLAGNWPISWGWNSPTNGATAFTVTNNIGAELSILVLSNRFSAFYSPVR